MSLQIENVHWENRWYLQLFLQAPCKLKSFEIINAWFLKTYILLYHLCFWNKIVSIQYFFLYVFQLHMSFHFMFSSSAEAVVQRYSVQKAFLKILQTASLLKKRLWHWGFPVNFAKFLRTSFLQNTSSPLLLHYFLFMEAAFDSCKCNGLQMFFRPEGLWILQYF